MPKPRAVTSVHVDIARLAYEVSALSADSSDKWLRDLVRCLVMRDPLIHPYGAFLLSEVEEYRKGEIERKRRFLSEESALSMDSAESADSLPNKSIKSIKEKSLSAPPKERARDEIWDEICRAFQLEPVTASERSRVGKIVRDLKQKQATPEDIAQRLDRYSRAWPQAARTPEALAKHWDAFRHPDAHERAAEETYL